MQLLGPTSGFHVRVPVTKEREMVQEREGERVTVVGGDRQQGE